MRKFLIAAGLAAAVAGLMNVPRAEAMTFSLPPGMANQLNIIEQVALCFYIDGWSQKPTIGQNILFERGECLRFAGKGGS